MTFSKVSPTAPLVPAVPAAVGLTADTAPQTHLAHRLEDSLVRNAGAGLDAQAHSHLPVPAPVGDTREDLGDLAPRLRPGRLLGVREHVAVRGPREAGSLQEVRQVVCLCPESSATARALSRLGSAPPPSGPSFF